MCIFHKWVYSKPQKYISPRGTRANGYELRRCHKCQKIQQNNGYFETSLNPRGQFTNRWVTVGYGKLKQRINEERSCEE
ncbi:MAG: hypothetical protein ACTSU7_00045 [Candidatus Heimdallarchaeaceae archaeon]